MLTVQLSYSVNRALYLQRCYKQRNELWKSKTPKTCFGKDKLWDAKCFVFIRSSSMNETENFFVIVCDWPKSRALTARRALSNLETTVSCVACQRIQRNRSEDVNSMLEKEVVRCKGRPSRMLRVLALRPFRAKAAWTPMEFVSTKNRTLGSQKTPPRSQLVFPFEVLDACCLKRSISRGKRLRTQV